MPPLVEVVGVGHRYGDVVALQDVSFAIERGEVFGLLGPNGAGKTTFLSILSGLRWASAGEIRVEHDRLHPGNRALKRKIGLVPQELALYPELTAAENLRFFGALYGIESAELNRRVTRILETIGLSERAERRAATFSGGMQRRLNLGIALVHEPTLLLLDEPTAGVDPQSRNHLFDGIRRLHESGMTIVYTSHYMEEVEALCQRVGIIDHGRLIACDTLEGLTNRLPGTVRFRLAVDPLDWTGLIVEARFRLTADPPRWSGQIAEEAALEPDGDGWRILCRDVSATAVRLVAWCAGRGLVLTRLETEAPNLERVFLQLTGRALRD
jgi:ABC-2 type transport system ATP-binding protein